MEREKIADGHTNTHSDGKLIYKVGLWVAALVVTVPTPEINNYTFFLDRKENSHLF
jgi:hypothetical protein